MKGKSDNDFRENFEIVDKYGSIIAWILVIIIFIIIYGIIEK